MKINESVIVNDFLRKKTTNAHTASTYRNILKKYFNILGVKDIDSYFKSDRDYTKDVWTVVESIGKYAPKTQKTYLACVKVFLERYDVELKRREWEDIMTRNNLRRARPITQKATPNNADMRAILSYGDIKSRTLFVFACTTGMRIDEILCLTFDDIDMKKCHVRIGREIAKGGSARDTFFSNETKELIEQWLPERERLLLRRYRKSPFVRNKLEQEGFKLRKRDGDWYVYKGRKKVSKEELIKMENRLFPFEYQNASTIWHNLLDKAGEPYNKKDGNYSLYNIHSLRRFWFTQMESSGANINFINYMGGHESELNSDYTHFDVKKLKEDYDKHQKYLSIFSRMDQIDKLIKPELQKHDTTISKLVIENVELKRRHETDKYEIEKLKTSVKEIQKILLLRTGDRTEEEIKKLKYHGLLKDDED